jgi:phosphohistidine phosphatase
MNLYLIRHADALPLGAQGVTQDEDRPLSDEGHKQCRTLAHVLANKGVRLDKIVSSPLLRTRETTQGIIDSLPDPKPEMVLADELAPGGKRRKLARFLRRLAGNDIALVGHMPDLGEFTAWLIGGKKAQINLAKSGVAYIDCDKEADKGTGLLLWLISPNWYPDEALLSTTVTK